MNFLADGVSRLEKTLHKIMVLIMKKYWDSVKGESYLNLSFSDKTYFKCFIFSTRHCFS